MRQATDKCIQSVLAWAEFKLAPRGERLYCVTSSPTCPVPIKIVFNLGQGMHQSLSHTCSTDPTEVNTEICIYLLDL